MPGLNRMDGSAVCPFYRRIRWQSREIVCESPVLEASVSALRFSREEDMWRYGDAYCCDIKLYKSCPIYRAVADKYKDQED